MMYCGYDDAYNATGAGSQGSGNLIGFIAKLFRLFFNQFFGFDTDPRVVFQCPGYRGSRKAERLANVIYGNVFFHKVSIVGLSALLPCCTFGHPHSKSVRLIVDDYWCHRLHKFKLFFIPMLYFKVISGTWPGASPTQQCPPPPAGHIRWRRAGSGAYCPACLPESVRIGLVPPKDKWL